MSHDTRTTDTPAYPLAGAESWLLTILERADKSLWPKVLRVPTGPVWELPSADAATQRTREAAERLEAALAATRPLVPDEQWEAVNDAAFAYAGAIRDEAGTRLVTLACALATGGDGSWPTVIVHGSGYKFLNADEPHDDGDRGEA